MTNQKQYKPTPFSVWLTIGQANPWISRAYDPPFTANSFHICKDQDELLDKLCGDQSWCLGQAFVLGDVCFIQQVDGGDEWLTIRRDIAFESMSTRTIGSLKMREYLERIATATDEQLRTLDY